MVSKCATAAQTLTSCFYAAVYAAPPCIVLCSCTHSHDLLLIYFSSFGMAAHAVHPHMLYSCHMLRRFVTCFICVFKHSPLQPSSPASKAPWGVQDACWYRHSCFALLPHAWLFLDPVLLSPLLLVRASLLRCCCPCVLSGAAGWVVHDQPRGVCAGLGSWRAGTRAGTPGEHQAVLRMRVFVSSAT